MKNNYPLLSIITCVFNGDKYISKLFESVLSLDYPYIEHIVVNDGSTDKTEDIILKYSALYQNKQNSQYVIKYIKQKNKGLGSATNSALQEITGKYWTWINCDDWYDSKEFSILLHRLPSFKGKLIILNYTTYNSQVGLTRGSKISFFERKKYHTKNLARNFFSYRLKYTHFIVDTQFYDSINKKRIIYPYRYTQDVQFMAQIYSNVYKSSFYFKPVVFFNEHANSLYSVYKEGNCSDLELAILSIEYLSLEPIIVDCLKELAVFSEKIRVILAYCRRNRKNVLDDVDFVASIKHFYNTLPPQVKKCFPKEIFIYNRIKKIPFSFNVYNKIRKVFSII